MLYLEDDRRDLWPVVVRALSSLVPLDVVVYLYPDQDEAHFEPPFEASDDDEFLERVTTYPDGVETLRSGRVSVDEEMLAHLEQHADELEEWGDSLVLYRTATMSMVAATIPHEGMILVADEFGSPLEATGLFLGTEQPEDR